MSELTAEQAHIFVHNVVSGILKNESRTTKSILAAVPNANLDYRPDPCAKTANELLRHIASADNFFLIGSGRSVCARQSEDSGGCDAGRDC